MNSALENLTQERLEVFRALRQRVPSDQPHSDDADLLRFLRARKFDIEGAQAMLLACQKWRQENNVDEILLEEMPLRDELAGVVKNAYSGVDKNGSPLYIERTGLIDVPALVALPAVDMDRRHIYHMEYLVQQAKESSLKLGRPVETISAIMDMRGIGLQHRECLPIMKRVSKLDNNYYPERMGRTFLINVPWIFHSLWRVARLFLDPETLEKFVILDAAEMDKLLQYIPADQLPEEYGGTAVGVLPLLPGESPNDRIERTVGPRRRLVRDVVLNAKDGEERARPVRVDWSFCMTTRDILFTALWLEEGACDDANAKGGGVEVEENRRVLQSDGLVTGSYSSLTPGVLRLVWENDSGWYQKVIEYRTTTATTEHEN